MPLLSLVDSTATTTPHKPHTAGTNAAGTNAANTKKPTANQTPPINVGIVGLGSVGSAVVRQLCERANGHAHNDNIVISHVCVRDRHKPRDCTLSTHTTYVDTPADIVTHVDVVIEVAGGKEPPIAALYETALSHKKPVISANKAYLACYDFVNRALELNIPIGFEAAVAGGIPIIHTMNRVLRVGKVGSLRGILNGTCNYILSTMEQAGQEYPTTLASAQQRGFAEIDPTLDINGTDTAHKIALLSVVAMGWHIDVKAIPTQGIEPITALDFHHANSMSYTIRLIGQLLLSPPDAQPDTTTTHTQEPPETSPHDHHALVAEVAPMLVPHNSTFASTVGVDNAVCAVCPPLGALTLRGPGAGGDATASAIISDLLDITQQQPSTSPIKPSRHATVLANPYAYPYYVRLTVVDTPGVIAKIGHQFAVEDISIHTLIQADPHLKEDVATIIIKTHPTTQNRITTALNHIAQSDYTLDHPLALRICDEP